MTIREEVEFTIEVGKETDQLIDIDPLIGISIEIQEKTDLEVSVNKGVDMELICEEVL